MEELEDPDELLAEVDELALSDFDEELSDDELALVSFLVELLELDPLSLLSASRVEPKVPAERLSVL